MKRSVFCLAHPMQSGVFWGDKLEINHTFLVLLTYLCYYFAYSCDRIFDSNNMLEEGFILSYSLREFSLFWRRRHDVEMETKMGQICREPWSWSGLAA